MSGRHPRHGSARDQDVEGHHQPQIDPASDVVEMDPCGHEKPPVLPVKADAEVQVAVVGAEDEFVVGFMTGREDWSVGFAGFQA